MKRLILLFLVGIFIAIPFHGNAATLFEGFESGVVPPSGWTVEQVLPNENTWEIKTIGSPYEGSYAANFGWSSDFQVDYLLSPIITPMAGPFTVEAWSQGSTYWGRDTYDNYNLALYLVYDSIYFSDLVGTFDEDWGENWAWSKSTFDLAGLFSPGVPVRLGYVYMGGDGADAGLDNITIQYTSNTVPEPATMLLLGLGLLGLVGVRRKMRK